MKEQNPIEMTIVKPVEEDYYFLRLATESSLTMIDIGDEEAVFDFHKKIAALSEQIVKICKSEVIH